MKNTLLLLLLGFSSIACETGTSVSFEKDFINKVTTKGNGLTCDKLDILIDGKIAKSNEIIYGQKIEFNFNKTAGFKREKGFAFPGLKMIVLSEKGDTIVSYGDLYEEYNEKGIGIDPLTLYAELTVAAPIASGQNYEVEILIWDKKGDGTFKMNYDFILKKDDKISTKGNGVKAGEIYLYAEESKKVITDHIITKKEVIDLFIEDIEGFTEKDGLVYPGFSAKITDANNLVVLDKPDLFDSYTLTGAPAEVFNKQIYMNFDVYGKDLKGPVTIQCKLWDKKGDKFLELKTKLDVKD